MRRVRLVRGRGVCVTCDCPRGHEARLPSLAHQETIARLEKRLEERERQVAEERARSETRLLALGELEDEARPPPAARDVSS